MTTLELAPKRGLTSKTLVLKILDALFVITALLLLPAALGLPVHRLIGLAGMPLPEFRFFALFVLFSTLLLSHAIATSDSAP